MLSTDEGAVLDVGYARLRLLFSTENTNGAFALTEQPLEARALAGPLHTHANEDGFICVVSGRLGAQVDQVTVEVRPGGVVPVPRRTMHTFWNPRATEAVALEFLLPLPLGSGLLSSPNVRSRPARTHRPWRRQRSPAQ